MRHTRRVVALELSVVGFAGEVALGHSTHRGCKGRVPHHRRRVRVEGGDRGGLQGDGPDPLAGILVDDGLAEVVKRCYIGDRDGEVPDRPSC